MVLIKQVHAVENEAEERLYSMIDFQFKLLWLKQNFHALAAPRESLAPTYLMI